MNASLVSTTQAPADTPATPLPVSAVVAVGMTVADMDRSLDFYTRVLPFVKVSDVEVEGRAYERLVGVFGARARIVRLRLGSEHLELTEYLAPSGRPMPADIRGQRPAAMARTSGRTVSRRRSHRDRLDDTDASLAWYRGTLGLLVAGASENHDVEQEHLNTVFGARLRITTLRAAQGPGIELLEYLAPRDGRPAPLDLRANGHRALADDAPDHGPRPAACARTRASPFPRLAGPDR